MGSTRRTMVEERPWLAPFVWLELPCLACCQDAHHPVPCIVAEFCKRLDAVDDEVAILSLSFLPRWVDVSAFTIDSDDVLRPCDALGGRSSLCICRRVETVSKGLKFVSFFSFLCVRVEEGIDMKISANFFFATDLDSWKNRLTLYIVIRDVGEEEMMMIGNMLPARHKCRHRR